VSLAAAAAASHQCTSEFVVAHGWCASEAECFSGIWHLAQQH
jgi:hypothetical protein